MKRHLLLLAGLFFAGIAFLGGTAHACTIFVLTDADRVLFCNNEDWSNPVTRIWFVPAGEGYAGGAYVGFDNGWAQGGLNTQGLAFDWVAGFTETWEPNPALRSVRGNPSVRMLETCATVEDAVAFYRANWEPSFSYAKILVADRTGASVIVGARDGQLQVEKAKDCRGFGYGRQTLDKMLAASPEATVESGAAILQACRQDGQYATKYSNVFDLKSGDIFVFRFPDQTGGVKLSLAAELEKGAHYYDIPKIREQLTQAPQPLQNNMKRFLLDEFPPIPDTEPDITKHLRAIIQDATGGVLRPEDFTEEFWKAIAPQKKEILADLASLGDFASLTLVDRKVEDGRRSYLYLMDFGSARVLQRFVLDDQNKVSFIRIEGSEQKPEAGMEKTKE